MKLLVTGGAGFIGANFMYYLKNRYPSEKHVCLDLLTYAGRRERLKDAESTGHCRFVRGDVCDKKTVVSLLKEEKIDAVINFAAESHVDRSIKEPHLFLKTNVLGTQVLLDSCLEAGVERFHQVSTDEVYGDLPLQNTDLLFHEHSPIKPSSPYSASKAAADLLALAYARTYGLNVTVSRCSNNYGPFQHEEKLIPSMILRAMNGEKLPLYGTGKNVRDWLYVEEHCLALDMILRRGKSGEVYNIGGKSERSNLQVVKEICKILGVKGKIEFVEDRKGHDLRYGIDPSKMWWDFGWLPQTDFETGLKKTVEWYVERWKSMHNV